MSNQKLTFDHVTSLIESVDYNFKDCATTCYITVGDAIVEATAHAFSMENYSEELGKTNAYKKALDKLFELEAYHLKRLRNGEK